MVLFKEARIDCQRYSAVIWSVVGGAIFAGTFGFASNVKEDLSKDPDYREELGVNQFTAPSIDKVFASLDALKPIPFDAVTRPVTELNTNDRSKYALAFGVLIGDGFLDVAAERDQDLPALGRELIRRAKGLGVGERVARHSKRVLDLGQVGAWDKLRKELSVTQADVENAMLALHDDWPNYSVWAVGFEGSRLALSLSSRPSARNAPNDCAIGNCLIITWIA
jgi:hypothetical protein